MIATTGQILGKAHKLCEWLRSSMPALYQHEHAVPMSWAVEDSVKWHVGSVDDLPNPTDIEIFKTIPMRLPQRSVLVEGDVSVLMADGRIATGVLFGLLRDTNENSIDCFFFLKVVDFSFCGGCRLTFTEDGTPAIGRFGDGSRKIDSVDKLTTNVNVIRRFLLALNCTNVRGVDNSPPAALNRKRQKAGKLPLFTYKTLHVLAGYRSASHDPRADDAEAKRSPRLHFRRGHVRRIGDGRITWVQQCMVGNRRLGVVEKAYALEAR